MMALLQHIYLTYTIPPSNKFYDMKQINITEWKATWGRIGTHGQSKIYPMSKWSEMYNQKINKDYILDAKYVYLRPEFSTKTMVLEYMMKVIGSILYFKITKMDEKLINKNDILDEYSSYTYSMTSQYTEKNNKFQHIKIISAAYPEIFLRTSTIPENNLIILALCGHQSINNNLRVTYVCDSDKDAQILYNSIEEVIGFWKKDGFIFNKIYKN